MKVTKQILGVALIALVAVACKNTKFKKTKDGFPYKVFSAGKGDKIVAGNVIRFHTTSRLGDSLLGTSYGQPPRTLPIPKEGPGLEGVQLFFDAKKGDSILLLQPVDSILAKNPMAAGDSFLLKNKGKNIETIIKIVEVFKDQETANAVLEKEQFENSLKDPATAQQKAKDDAEINAYLKANNISATQSPLGFYIQKVSPGNGQKAKVGDFMMLRYTGKDLTGRIFDTNNKPDGQLMPYQVGSGGMISGFANGVKELSKGEKAVIYIPSVFGYGPQGNPPLIQPNQNLIFEVEVVDISDKAPSMAPTKLPDSTTK